MSGCVVLPGKANNYYIHVLQASGYKYTKECIYIFISQILLCHSDLYMRSFNRHGNSATNKLKL